MYDTEFWVAVASAVAAWGAALFAYRSTRIARRILELSEEQARARVPQLVPYLVAGLVRRLEKRQTRLYAFSVSVSNRADIDNSLSALELQITYTRVNNMSSNLLLPHDPTLTEHFGLEGTQPLIVPKPINAHQTIAGWAFFEIDDSLLGDVDIDRYEIRFFDSHENISSLEPIILREIVDEATLAQS